MGWWTIMSCMGLGIVYNGRHVATWEDFKLYPVWVSQPQDPTQFIVTLKPTHWLALMEAKMQFCPVVWTFWSYPGWPWPVSFYHMAPKDTSLALGMVSLTISDGRGWDCWSQKMRMVCAFSGLREDGPEQNLCSLWWNGPILCSVNTQNNLWIDY
jgi:hypothetical protein